MYPTVTPVIKFVVLSTQPESLKQKKLQYLVDTQKDDFLGTDNGLPSCPIEDDLDIMQSASAYLKHTLNCSSPPITLEHTSHPDKKSVNGARFITFLFYVVVPEDNATEMSNERFKWKEMPDLFLNSDLGAIYEPSQQYSITIADDLKDALAAHKLICEMKGIEFIVSILDFAPTIFTSRDAEMTAALFNRDRKHSFMFFRYLKEITGGYDDPDKRKIYPENPNIISLGAETIDDLKKNKRQGKPAQRFQKKLINNPNS